MCSVLGSRTIRYNREAPRQGPDGAGVFSEYAVSKRGKGLTPPPDDVWLFDQGGADLGFMSGAEAVTLADRQGQHLVRLDHTSSPPRYQLRVEPHDDGERA